jgi:hypothetical protein
MYGQKSERNLAAVLAVDIKLGPDIQARIGMQLRSIYSEVIDQGVPERFVQLLKRLDDTMQVIDWDLAPQKLRSGDLSMLVSAVEQAIREAASNKQVIALARTLGLDPVVFIVGLLAPAARSHRAAARIARAIFGSEVMLGIERLPA